MTSEYKNNYSESVVRFNKDIYGAYISVYGREVTKQILTLKPHWWGRFLVSNALNCHYL